MTVRDDGVVYAIQATWGGPVKIGFTGSSASIDQRLASLQTGNPSRLVIRGAMPGTRETEAEIHSLLATHRAHGEWFHSNDDMWRILNEVWDTDIWLGEVMDLVGFTAPFQGYRCTWKNVDNSVEREGDIRLYWEVDGDPVSDEYDPDEISARSLWRKWTSYLGRRNAGDRLRIYWFAESPTAAAFEAAPFTDVNDDWLTYYTWPRLCTTREPVLWGALPVVNKRWNTVRADKGGFIQEATGWKPSALQPYVSLSTLERMAGMR